MRYAVLALLFLGACTTVAPRVITQEVRVPIPVKCRPNIPARPAYPDVDDALVQPMTTIERVKLLLEGREIREARELVLEAALKGCEG